MNTKITAISASLLLTVAAVLCAEPAAPGTASPEFQKMKTLAGTWQGKADMGQGPVDMTVNYHLIAAGNVLEEVIFPGTPNEMVTMYYDKDGKLSLTHYCVLGNRPAMSLKSSNANTIEFDFDGSCCNIDPTKESHMHAMTLRFDDADTITTGCKAVMDGKTAPEHLTTLKRVKSSTAAN